MGDYVSADAFNEHAKAEEANQRVTADALHEGNLRMGNIEAELKELATDLKPLLRLYHAVMGASVLGTFFIGLLIFIYSQDKNSIRVIGETVQRQGVVLEKLILKHEELERDTRKEQARLETTIEKHRH